MSTQDKAGVNIALTDRNVQAWYEGVGAVQSVIHKTNVAKGFWDEPRNDSEALMLMVTEIAEGCEGLRHGNPPSDHIPKFTAIEEEMADTIIRILDMAEGRQWRVAQALIAKLEFNLTRPHKHGKAF